MRDISHRMDYLRASSACILIADAGFEEYFSELPEAFGGAEGEFHGFGCLGHGHADEVAELDQFGDLVGFFFEVGKGFVPAFTCHFRGGDASEFIIDGLATAFPPIGKDHLHLMNRIHRARCFFAWIGLRVSILVFEHIQQLEIHPAFVRMMFF